MYYRSHKMFKRLLSHRWLRLSSSSQHQKMYNNSFVSVFGCRIKKLITFICLLHRQNWHGIEMEEEKKKETYFITKWSLLSICSMSWHTNENDYTKFSWLYSNKKICSIDVIIIENRLYIRSINANRAHNLSGIHCAKSKCFFAESVFNMLKNSLFFVYVVVFVAVSLRTNGNQWLINQLEKFKILLLISSIYYL